MSGNGERERNNGRGSEVRKHLEIAYLRGQTNLRLNGHEEMGVHLNLDGEILSYGGVGCGWADPKERHAIFLSARGFYGKLASGDFVPITRRRTGQEGERIDPETVILEESRIGRFARSYAEHIFEGAVGLAKIGYDVRVSDYLSVNARGRRSIFMMDEFLFDAMREAGLGDAKIKTGRGGIEIYPVKAPIACFSPGKGRIMHAIHETTFKQDLRNRGVEARAMGWHMKRWHAARKALESLGFKMNYAPVN